ncbi:DapA-like [Sesbania bispinosa]|nr:DapA-like [Sesbania bispinosa]
MVGVKECFGNDRIKQYTGQGIVVWSGFDKGSHDARWDCGVAGVQSISTNLIPGSLKKFEGCEL